MTETGSGHKGVVDAGVKAGGKNHGPSPMELLLVGMAGCTGIDVVEILKKKRLDVTGLEVRVEGTRAETHPMVYTCIDVVYVVRGKDIPPRAVEQAIAKKAKVVWMQPGAENMQAAERAMEAGLEVLMGMCMMREHRALAPKS